MSDSMENRTVDVAGRRYTVNCYGDAISVRVHCISKPGRYCVAFRRLDVRTKAAMRAIAAAGWGGKIASGICDADKGEALW